MTQWAHKTWLITGASAGIGMELAREVLARGGKVIATARNPATLKELAASSGGRALALKLDVTQQADVDAVMAQAAAFGGVDVLVNNAGYGCLGSIEESPESEVRAMYEVNLFGPMRMMQAVMPAMRARGGGYILNVSSIAGSFGGGAGGYYSGTKFGLEGITESLMREGAQFNIKAMIVIPGAIRTNFFGRSMVKANGGNSIYDAVKQTYAYADAGDGKQPGDPVRCAQMIVDAVNAEGPFRLLLGLESHMVVAGALKERYDELDAQKVSSLGACYPECLPK